MEYKNIEKGGDKKINTFQKLDMKHVKFSYTEDVLDIDDVCLEIKKGEKVAIVGPSGSGKTTIIKLLLNVLQNYSGEICINDNNMKTIDTEFIGYLFSVITQIPVAINGTIRENVDIFHSMEDEEILKILEIVDLRKDIEKLPLGLNTFVGENGQNISGGQKQRLAIVRALSTNPEVIVFDEATSNLDPVTEGNIYKQLKKKKITQIVVAHRLNSIQDADKIYVVDHGRVVESGLHNELLSMKGIYYSLSSNPI